LVRVFLGDFNGGSEGQMIFVEKSAHVIVQTRSGGARQNFYANANILSDPDWRRSPAAIQLSPVISSSWIYREHKSSRCETDEILCCGCRGLGIVLSSIFRRRPWRTRPHQHPGANSCDYVCDFLPVCVILSASFIVSDCI
jgi:hypothetical protein